MWRAIFQQWSGLLQGSLTLFLQLAIWLLALGLVFGLLERWRPREMEGRNAGDGRRESLSADLAYYFIGGLVPSFVIAAGAVLSIVLLHPLLPEAPRAAMAGLPAVVKIGLGVVLGDFAYYWAHRAQHALPALWRLHAIHHSPTKLDWLVNTRAHPLDLSLSQIAAFAMMYIVGVAKLDGGGADPVASIVVVITTAQAFFVHANTRLRLGWLEKVLVTPAFHHWHHANDGPATDNKNFGGIFPFWDRLFGTLHLPPDALPQRYGISAHIPAALWRQLLLPRVER